MGLQFQTTSGRHYFEVFTIMKAFAALLPALLASTKAEAEADPYWTPAVYTASGLVAHANGAWFQTTHPPRRLPLLLTLEPRPMNTQSRDTASTTHTLMASPTLAMPDTPTHMASGSVTLRLRPMLTPTGPQPSTPPVASWPMPTALLFQTTPLPRRLPLPLT